jgi:hypothetical protein
MRRGGRTSGTHHLLHFRVPSVLTGQTGARDGMFCGMTSRDGFDDVVADDEVALMYTPQYTHL